jgi:hypothetical protein
MARPTFPDIYAGDENGRKYRTIFTGGLEPFAITDILMGNPSHTGTREKNEH